MNMKKKREMKRSIKKHMLNALIIKRKIRVVACALQNN